MSKIYFKASNDSIAKKIVAFWNPYCMHINNYIGNGRGYLITYNDTTYEITGYECRSPKSGEDARIFEGITPFMEFPTEIKDEMIRRSTSKSPVAFVLCEHAGASNGGFDWSETSEGHDFWSEIIGDHNFDLFYKHFNTKHYESRLSEQESPLRRGSGINTSGICCRKHKARVTVVSPGYKEIFGRG